MKKVVPYLFVVLFVVGAIVLIVVGGVRSSNLKYVCLEVNPRIEFLTDRKDRVQSVKPLNAEAKELIINEDFVGLTMKEACDKFLTLCAKSGYIKVDSKANAVKVSVLSGFNQSLEVDLYQTINKFYVDNNIYGVVVDSSQDLQQYKDAKKMGVNSEKYDLMMAVKESNPNLELKDLKKLSNRKLINKIKESHDKYNFEYSETELNNKVKLLDFYRTIYENHKERITDESTRLFKENLKKYREENTKNYKLDYNETYNEWLFG